MDTLVQPRLRSQHHRLVLMDGTEVEIDEAGSRKVSEGDNGIIVVENGIRSLYPWFNVQRHDSWWEQA